jgi:hypothetical protein
MIIVMIMMMIIIIIIIKTTQRVVGKSIEDDTSGDRCLRTEG